MAAIFDKLLGKILFHDHHKEDDDRYVNKSGDEMGGDLTMPSGNSVVFDTSKLGWSPDHGNIHFEDSYGFSFPNDIWIVAGSHSDGGGGWYPTIHMVEDDYIALAATNYVISQAPFKLRTSGNKDTKFVENASGTEKTITFQDLSGTVALLEGEQTFTGNKTFDAAVTYRELSSDPSDPDEGSHVIWQSDGTGSGDDGDIMMKITAGGVTKTTTLVDFSTI